MKKEQGSASPKNDFEEDPEAIKADKSRIGKALVKRLKQIERDSQPDKAAAVILKDDVFTFAGNIDLVIRYAMDLIVRRAHQVGTDPLQVVYDLLFQYGYAKKGNEIILPADHEDTVKKPHPSGDGAPKIIIPGGGNIH